MKKTTYLLFYLSIFFSAVSNYGCRENKYEVSIPSKILGIIDVKSIYKKNLDQVSINFKDSLSGNSIRIESSVEDSILKSTFFYEQDKLWVAMSSFEVNLKDSDYRQKMSGIVIKKAQFLKEKFKVSELSEMSNIFDAIPELLYNKLGNNFFKESSQVMFYHMGVVNTARRALESASKDCECSINVSYTKAKTPFVCLEDRYIKADNALKILVKMSNGRKIAGKQFNPVRLENYLKENPGKPLNADKLGKIINAEVRNFWYDELTEEERKAVMAENKRVNSKAAVPGTKEEPEPETCEDGGEELRGTGEEQNSSAFVPCSFLGVYWGNQCGCCGNYSTTCKCCSWICLAHDNDCAADCLPSWWCGSQCQIGCP